MTTTISNTRSLTPKRSLADDLQPLTPEWGKKYISATVAGDLDAVRSLILAAENNQRGKIVAALRRYRVAPDVLRTALENVYGHDHGHLCRALHRGSLVAAFKAAKFSIVHLDNELTIWRGGVGDDDLLLSGLSWTRDRDCACWFAMRFPDPFLPARVVKATIKREQVLAHLTIYQEDEILIEPFSVSVETDGNVDEWKETAQRVCQRRAAQRNISKSVIAGGREYLCTTLVAAQTQSIASNP
jgi:hypothetical protein